LLAILNGLVHNSLKSLFHGKWPNSAICHVVRFRNQFTGANFLSDERRVGLWLHLFDITLFFFRLLLLLAWMVSNLYLTPKGFRYYSTPNFSSFRTGIQTLILP
jgi:hypothetical protein